MSDLRETLRGLRHLWRARRTGSDLGDLWRRRDGRPRVWAHRGASAHATENTMEAFAAAAAARADGIELDVRITRDGSVVVFHDDDLMRLAGRSATIEEMSAVEVASARLQGGERIPTLAEVMAAWPTMPLNVEMKAHPLRPSGLASAVAQVVAPARPELILVSSFSPVALAQFTLAAPRFATAFLFDEAWQGALGVPAPFLGAHVLHPHHPQVTADRMRQWRAFGYPINTYTVDDPNRLRELAALGVDGVFANDPAAAIAVLNG